MGELLRATMGVLIPVYLTAGLIGIPIWMLIYSLTGGWCN